MRNWLKGMNEEQAEVIGHVNGPLYVAAVAGSGKTRALVNRIARLVFEEQVPGERIIAMTFSKKAADEMNERLSRDLDITTARVGTWHSFAMQVLKETSYASWRVDEKNAYKGLVKEAIGYKFLDWKGADVSKVLSFIGFCKACLFKAESPEALSLARQTFGGLQAPNAVQAYRIADGLAHGKGLLTFDDMLVFTARYLSVEDNAARWAAKFDYVLADEDQDANPAQKAIAKALASGHRNYMVVGDLNQAIYGFRASDPKLFAAFPAEWNAKKVSMARNYRCGAAIIDAANRVIAKAEFKSDALIAERGTAGEVKVVTASHHDEEAAEVVSWVQGHQVQGGELGDLTVLYRTNAQSRALEDKLIKAKVPYTIVGGSCFYERKEVKDLLGYLRVATGQDHDADGVRRCINAPFRFLGKAFVERVMRLAQEHASSDEAPDWGSVVLEAADQAGIQRRQAASANEWAGIIERLGAMIVDQAREAGAPGHDRGNAGSILGWLVQATGYVEWLVKEEGEESVENSTASNVRELVRLAGAFATVADLLDYVDRNVREQERQRRKQSGDRVLLMSIHRSKGLEWPKVWIVGCNEMVLPHAKGDIEEERRLFYVATTRARDELVYSYVSKIALRAKVSDVAPSRFLLDACPDLAQRLAATRVAAAGAAS